MSNVFRIFVVSLRSGVNVENLTVRGEGSNVESLTMRGYGGESNDCWMIYIFTQRAQRAQRFYPHSYSRLRWSGRKLRYDERAQRV